MRQTRDTEIDFAFGLAIGFIVGFVFAAFTLYASTMGWLG